MKILHVLDVSLPHRQSGYSIRSKYIVEIQKELGYEPVVVTRYGGLVDEVELINGISYWRHTTEDIWRDMQEKLGGFHLPDTPHVCHMGARLRFGKRLGQVIEAEAPDVVHVASPECNAIVAIEVGHHYGLPVVYELWPESSVAQGMLDVDSDAFVEQWALHVQAMKQADAVVTLSEVLKAECVQEGVDEAEVFVVPNGVCSERCGSKEGTWQTVVGRYKAVYRRAIAACGEKTRAIPKVPGKKRIAFYSQHLVGVGHHFRNRQIVSALSQAHDVFFIDGGRAVPGIDLPRSVAKVTLPPLCAGPGGLMAEDSDQDLNVVLYRRRVLLDEAMMQIKADVFCIEFFPFCRWSLRAEIIDAIEVALRISPDVKVVCSLRDIPTRAQSGALQPMTALPHGYDGDALRFYSTPFGGVHHEQVNFNRRYYEEVIPTLNAYFDAVLVHGDPKLSRLEDHFLWVEDIGIPVVYTGFVSENLSDFSRPLKAPDRYVLVSAGGGAEGYALAAPCIEAWKRLAEKGITDGRELVVFAGAFIHDVHFDALKEMCGNSAIRIDRFTSGFLQWMHHADLSISRAGYNTCMNVLETRTQAILVPSITMDDQEFRTQRLMDLGIAQMVHPDQLSVGRMMEAIVSGFGRPKPDHRLALDGAEKTRRVVERL